MSKEIPSGPKVKGRQTITTDGSPAAIDCISKPKTIATKVRLKPTREVSFGCNESPGSFGLLAASSFIEPRILELANDHIHPVAARKVSKVKGR